jgi:hypothetical protein
MLELPHSELGRRWIILKQDIYLCGDGITTFDMPRTEESKAVILPGRGGL